MTELLRGLKGYDGIIEPPGGQGRVGVGQRIP